MGHPLDTVKIPSGDGTTNTDILLEFNGAHITAFKAVHDGETFQTNMSRMASLETNPETWYDEEHRKLMILHHELREAAIAYYNKRAEQLNLTIRAFDYNKKS